MRGTPGNKVAFTRGRIACRQAFVFGTLSTSIMTGSQGTGTDCAATFYAKFNGQVPFMLRYVTPPEEVPKSPCNARGKADRPLYFHFFALISRGPFVVHRMLIYAHSCSSLRASAAILLQGGQHLRKHPYMRHDLHWAIYNLRVLSEGQPHCSSIEPKALSDRTIYEVTST